MERKVHPGEWTRANIATMRAQLKRLGFALDWSREFATCEPDYYGHEQALFVDLYELASFTVRRARSIGPGRHDGVLANEQVIDAAAGARALWSSGAASQWFLKITTSPKSCSTGSGRSTMWPDKVRLMQDHWIGKSRG